MAHVTDDYDNDSNQWLLWFLSGFRFGRDQIENFALPFSVSDENLQSVLSDSVRLLEKVL